MQRLDLRAMTFVRRAIEDCLVSVHEAALAIEQWCEIGTERKIPMSEVLGAIAELSPAELIRLTATVDKELDYPPPPSDERRGAHRFEDLRPIGQGGMGLVYDAADPQLGRRIAIKFLRLDSRVSDGSTAGMPEDPALLHPGTKGGVTAALRTGAMARFAREARITGLLQHPGVIPIYEFGVTRYGVPYYTMRLIAGRRTLADEIQTEGAPRFQSRLPVLEMFLRVCDTLHYAHRKGIVHRDVKPKNIGLGDFGEVMVLDWGLAKDLAESEFGYEAPPPPEGDTADTLPHALGTVGYMSPEAVEGRVSDIGSPSDVFSLGVVLYEILTGRKPFACETFEQYREAVLHHDPASPHELDADIPVGLSDTCMAALNKNPHLRPAAAGVMAFAIRRWQQEWARERNLARLYGDTNDLIARANGVAPEEALTPAIMAKANVTKIRLQAPTDPRGKRLNTEVDGLVRRVENARLLVARRRTLRRLAIILLGFVSVLGLWTVKTLDENRRDMEQALRVAEGETRRATAANLYAAEVERKARRDMEAHLAADTGDVAHPAVEGQGSGAGQVLLQALLRCVGDQGTCDRETVDLIAALLEHEDPMLRLQAARTLGDLGPSAESAREALEAARSDEDLEVAAAARESLARLRH